MLTFKSKIWKPYKNTQTIEKIILKLNNKTDILIKYILKKKFKSWNITKTFIKVIEMLLV